MSEVRLFVPGIPAPQGSKEKWGAEANPRTAPWRAIVNDTAYRAMEGRALLDGPVFISGSFSWPRPKNHYRTGKNAGILRDDAPLFKVSTPDLDKCQRLVGDAFKGVVLKDDAQIVCWNVVKVYADQPGIRLTIREVSQPNDLIESILAIPATPTERISP